MSESLAKPSSRTSALGLLCRLAFRRVVLVSGIDVDTLWFRNGTGYLCHELTRIVEIVRCHVTFDDMVFKQ